MLGPINRIFLINQSITHLPAYTTISLIKQFFIIIIKSYKYMVSGFIPNVCRFTPSCSDYVIEALQEHGVFAGCWLSIKRLLRCHPLYNKTGYDPVP